MERYIEDPAAAADLRRLGENVASWRKIQRLTQEQLARRAGVSRPVITRMERGDEGVGIGALLRVAGVLGIGDQLVNAVDPLETAYGRQLADRAAVRRVRVIR
jgi:transcriptional regulator with XRE-family HTH domain